MKIAGLQCVNAFSYYEIISKYSVWLYSASQRRICALAVLMDESCSGFNNNHINGDIHSYLKDLIYALWHAELLQIYALQDR